MLHNICMSAVATEPWPVGLLFHIVRLLPLYIFQTIKDFFMKLYKYYAGSENSQRKKLTLLSVLPPPFSMVGHVVSPLSVRMSVPTILLSISYVTQIVSVGYLLNRLVYWIEILYTGTCI